MAPHNAQTYGKRFVKMGLKNVKTALILSEIKQLRLWPEEKIL